MRTTLLSLLALALIGCAAAPTETVARSEPRATVAPLPSSCVLVGDGGDERVRVRSPLSLADLELLARRPDLNLELAALSGPSGAEPTARRSVTDLLPSPELREQLRTLQLTEVRLEPHGRLEAEDVAWLLPLSSLRRVVVTARDLSAGAARLLGAHPELEELVLHGCDPETPAAFGALGRAPRLRRLELHGAVGLFGDRRASVNDDALRALVTPAPPPLLERLALTSCPGLRGEALGLIATLPSLRDLDLSGCFHLGAFEALWPLAPRLTHLRLAEDDPDSNADLCTDSRGLVALGRLAALETLTVGIEDWPLDDEAWAALSDLRRLRELRLHGGSVRLGEAAARCFGALRNLERLGLSVHGFTGDGLRSLAGLPRLRELRLDLDAGSDPEEDQAADRLAALHALPGASALEVLWLELEGVPLDDELLRALGALPGLRVLEVRLADETCPPVSDAALERLPAGLEELVLHGHGITDRGLAALARRRGLARLEVEGGGITNAGVAHLAGLPRLRTLIVHGPGIDVGVGALLPRFPALERFESPAPLREVEGGPALRSVSSSTGCARCDPRSRE